MAWMDKYGEFTKQARAIRILGLVSTGLGAVTISGIIKSENQFNAIWVVSIHILGIILISAGVQLRKDSRKTRSKMPIATRAITFGWMMVTSFLWVPFVTMMVMNAVRSLAYS